MNVFEVIFTPQAEEQLEGIAHHIAVDLCNRIAAEEFVDNIIEQSLKLSLNPEKYRLIDEEPWGSRGVRKIKRKNWQQTGLRSIERFINGRSEKNE